MTWNRQLEMTHDIEEKLKDALFLVEELYMASRDSVYSRQVDELLIGVSIAIGCAKELRFTMLANNTGGGNGN